MLLVREISPGKFITLKKDSTMSLKNIRGGISRTSFKNLLISTALVSPFVLTIGHVMAGSVSGPGQSATVDSSSPVENWNVDDGATLNVLTGAATGFINSYDSTVNVTGATVTGATQAIELIGSNGTISDSTINSGPTSHAFIIRRSSAGGTTTATISGSTINAGIMGFDISGGARINIIDSDIQSGGTGVRALDGSTVNLTRTTIETSGRSGHGIHIASGSKANVVDSSITTNGTNAIGVQIAGAGSRAVIVDSSVTTNGQTAVAISNAGGEVHVVGSTIETFGRSSDGVNASGGTTEVRNTTITTHNDEAYGARVGNDAKVAIVGSEIITSGASTYGVNAAGIGSTVTLDNTNVTTTGLGAHTLFAYDNAVISVTGGKLSTTGDGAVGLRVKSAVGAINGTEISTAGATSHGILVNGGGFASATNSVIMTSGADAHGVRISSTGSADINDSTIIATGEQSNGVVVEGESNVNISESYIESNSIGLKLDYTGSANIDRTKIKSSGYAAISLAGSTDLKLSNSSVIASGDNGSALNLFSSTVITIPTRKGIEEHSINNVSLDSSYIYAEKAPAIRVASGTANIDVKNGSQIVGNGGTALEAFSDSETNLNADGNVAIWGDIIGGKAYFADQNDAIVNVSLENGSFWKGAGVNLNTVGIDTTSHWLMTGSSDVGVLSNDGVVEFDAAAPYKTLTAGTLDVNGGSFILNTKLNEGGAASETDKIVVTGDANGDGIIHVRNNGGTGAFTGTGATDGIQIVEVDGASNADFQLGSAAIVGIYDYQLKKADGQNWYLQTDGDDVVNPGEGDGGDSGTGHVVDIVPGYNIALAAAQNHVLTTIDTFHERLGELRADELQDGFHSWMRGIGKTGSYSPKSITGYNGHGFDMTTAGVQIGIDYSKGDVFIAGDKLTVGMFGEYANSSFDVRGRTADGSISSKGLGGYVTWQQKAPTERKPGTGAYVDAVIKHDWLDFGVNAKSVSGFKLQNGYKGTATTASIEAGYGFDLGNNVVLQPQAQLIYSKINADSFTDAYGIDVYGQSAESVIGRVGVRLEKTFYFGDEEETLEAAPVPAQNPKKAPKAGKGSKARTPTAVLPDAPKKKKFVKSVTTFADANAKREFKGKNGLVAAGTDIGNDMSGTRYDVGLGVVARVSENVSLFGRGSVEFGGSTNVAGKVSGGLKITW